MLIGLSGKKQSGKSTIANHLMDKHGFFEVSWAYPIKEIIGRRLFGFSEEELYGSLKDSINPTWKATPRQAYQYAGSVFREFYPDFWVILGLRRINNLLEKNRNVVVSDCRYLNEALAIKSLGGYILRIERENINNRDNHISEVDLDMFNFDERIRNSGELDLLKIKIDEFVDAIRKDTR